MLLGRRRRSQQRPIQLLGCVPLLPRLAMLIRFRQGLLLLRPDALLPPFYTRTVTQLLPLAPIDEFVAVADPNLTSHIHPMVRLLPPTPIGELVRTTNPNPPESHLLHAGGESEPHLSHTHYELAPHLLHPRQDPVPSADSHRGARVGGTPKSNLLHTRYDPASAVAAAAARPPSAAFLRTRYDPAPDTGSHRGASTGGASESHFSTTPPLTTADPSATATSPATAFVASSSPDATEGSADHFSAPTPPAARDTTATDAPTTETPTAPPLPPFHVPEGAKDGALTASSSPSVALDTADGVTTAAASSYPDVTAGTATDGPTAGAASAADDDMGVDTDPVPAVTVPPPLHVPVGTKDGTTAASSSPDVALGTADGAVTAATASAAETDPDVEMDPISAVTAPPTAEHTSPFPLHIRQSAAWHGFFWEDVVDFEGIGRIL